MKMSGKKLYDIILLVLLYLLSTTTFFKSFITSYELALVIQIILRLSFLIFAFFFIKKNKLGGESKTPLKKDVLLFLPFVTIVFSNIFVSLLLDYPRAIFDWKVLILEGLVFNILVSVAEEVVFRFIVLTALTQKYKPGKALVLSSLIFGGIHLVNISSFATMVPVLIQVIYTTVLGLILGLLYLNTKNIFTVFTFHFLFNFINGTLSSILFIYETNIYYYGLTALVGVNALLYLAWLFYLLNKKGGLTYVTNSLDY